MFRNIVTLNTVLELFKPDFIVKVTFSALSLQNGGGWVHSAEKPSGNENLAHVKLLTFKSKEMHLFCKWQSSYREPAWTSIGFQIDVPKWNPINMILRRWQFSVFNRLPSQSFWWLRDYYGAAHSVLFWNIKVLLVDALSYWNLNCLIIVWFK